MIELVIKDFNKRKVQSPNWPQIVGPPPSPCGLSEKASADAKAEAADAKDAKAEEEPEAEKAAEVVSVKEENPTAETETVSDVAETAAVTEEAIPAKPAEEIPEAAASETENSVDKILAETDALLSSLTSSDTDPAVDSPAVSYIGRHEAQKRTNSASSWYRPHDPDPDSK